MVKDTSLAVWGLRSLTTTTAPPEQLMPVALARKIVGSQGRLWVMEAL